MWLRLSLPDGNGQLQVPAALPRGKSVPWGWVGRRVGLGGYGRENKNLVPLPGKETRFLRAQIINCDSNPTYVCNQISSGPPVPGVQ